MRHSRLNSKSKMHLVVITVLYIYSITADILREDCPGYPIPRSAMNDSVDRFPCNRWPVIHQLANKVILGADPTLSLILSPRSFAFFSQLATFNKVSMTLDTDERFAGLNIQNNSVVVKKVKEMSRKLLWDVILHHISRLRSRHLIVFLRDTSDETHKEFLKVSVNLKAEIRVASCSKGWILDSDSYNRDVISDCDIKETTTIINTASNTGLLDHANSLFIVCNDTEAVEAILRKKKLPAIADVTLLTTVDYVEVRWQNRDMSNGSQAELVVVKNTTIHMTKITKVCREINITKDTYVLTSLQDLSTIQSSASPRTFSGCKLQIVAIERPPYVVRSAKEPGIDGNDFRFVELVNNALGFETQYHLLALNDLLKELIVLDFNSRNFKLLTDSDIVLPLLETREEIFKMFITSSPPFSSTYLSPLILTPPRRFGADSSFKTFLLPYSYKVWCSVTIIVLVTMIVWPFARHFHTSINRETSQGPSIYSSIWESACDLMSIMPMQGVPKNIPGLTSNIVMTTISIFTLLNVTCYSAVLLTFLADTKGALPYRSFHEFLDKEDSQFIAEGKIERVVDIVLHENLAPKGTETYRKIMRKKTRVLDAGADYANLSSKLGKNLYLQVAEVSELIAIKYAPQFVKPFGRVNRWDRTVLYQTNFPHKVPYFKAVRRLNECGFYNKIIRDHLYHLKYIENRRHFEIAITPVELHIVSILFQLLAVGIALSIATLTIEYLQKSKTPIKKTPNSMHI